MCSIAADATSATLTFREATPSFANAIRRTLLLEIPGVAVSSVDVRENTSFFACEVLAHRIGLVPPLPSVSENSRFILSAHGPIDVFSDALVDEDTYDSLFVKGIFLFRLAEGQGVIFSGSFRIGTGKENARFSHVSGVSIERVKEDNDVEEEGSKKKDSMVINFETINGEDPLDVSEKAAKVLLNRLESLEKSLSAIVV